MNTESNDSSNETKKFETPFDIFDVTLLTPGPLVAICAHVFFSQPRSSCANDRKDDNPQHGGPHDNNSQK